MRRLKNLFDDASDMIWWLIIATLWLWLFYAPEQSARRTDVNDEAGRDRGPEMSFQLQAMNVDFKR